MAGNNINLLSYIYDMYNEVVLIPVPVPVPIAVKLVELMLQGGRNWGPFTNDVDPF